MKKLHIVCSNIKSLSAKLLADELSQRLDYKILRSVRRNEKRENLIYGDQRDKLKQYNFFRDNKLNFPEFTESKEEVQNWMKNGCGPVVCRTLLRAKSGKGIVIADIVDQLVDAPVYVAYQKKTNEYRVNLFKGELVCVREKRLKKGYEKPKGRDGRIRSHDNGYVFCEPLEALPQEAIAMAKAAAKITGSDIVGVDIAFHKPSNYWFLLEVNSAPGMEGKTITQYADEIVKHFEEYQ